MELQIKPGKYVVAVSGGVDSVVLLDLLHHKIKNSEVKPSQVVVAHFDHGIRDDSEEDRRFVQELAVKYDMPFVYERSELGGGASEDVARQARYDFLGRTKEKSGARAIITAHHQDDLLETAVLNLLRGTGWRGMISLKSRGDIVRPLLHLRKSDLTAYAEQNGLEWREDSTNKELRYLRNYVRHKLLLSLQDQSRQEFLQLIRNIQDLSIPLEAELTAYLAAQPKPDVLDRRQFILLSHAVACEVMHEWLRRHGVHDLSSKLIERLVVAAKTFTPGKQADVDKGYILKVSSDALALRRRER